MSDGFCPFAVRKNIPPGPNDPPIKPRVAILHVTDGMADSYYDYFNTRSGGIESHFYVKMDGVIEQYRSIWYEADANYKANPFAVSIETQGYGPGKWTAAQIKSIRRLLRWLNKATNGRIPLRKCDRWNGSGIGYHVQFGAPGYWTPVAKSCPGSQRILQYHRVIMPNLNSTVSGRLSDYELMRRLRIRWKERNYRAVEALSGIMKDRATRRKR